MQAAKHEWHKLLSWWQFYLRWLKEAIVLSWGWTDSIASGLGIGVPLFIHFYPRTEARMTPLTWQVPIGAFACLGLFRLIMAPYVLYKEHHLVRETKESELQIELGRFRTARPKIDIQFGPLIEKGNINEGLQGIFVCADLRLEEPAEVDITAIKLFICPPIGVPQEATWVDDLPNWVRVIKAIRSYRPVMYPSAPKRLSQRGETVVCCFHFLLHMRESELFDSNLVLKLITPHGTCENTIRGSLASPDDVGKGMMMERNSSFVLSLWPKLSTASYA